MRVQLQWSLKETHFVTEESREPLTQLELHPDWAQTGQVQTINASTSTPGRKPWCSHDDTRKAFCIAFMILPVFWTELRNKTCYYRPQCSISEVHILIFTRGAAFSALRLKKIINNPLHYVTTSLMHINTMTSRQWKTIGDVPVLE